MLWFNTLMHPSTQVSVAHIQSCEELTYRLQWKCLHLRSSEDKFLGFVALLPLWQISRRLLDRLVQIFLHAFMIPRWCLVDFGDFLTFLYSVIGKSKWNINLRLLYFLLYKKTLWIEKLLHQNQTTPNTTSKDQKLSLTDRWMLWTVTVAQVSICPI